MQQERIDDQLHRIHDMLESLKENPADWVIMAGHYPVFSGGDHGDTDELLQYLLPLIEAYNVDVYLSGHDHISEHLQYGNTSYYVVGAGCMTDKLKDTSLAPLLWYGVGYSAFAGMTATSSTLKIEFVDTNNEIKYTHTLEKPNPRPGPADNDSTPDNSDKDNNNDNDSPVKTKPDPTPDDTPDTDPIETTEPPHQPDTESTDESTFTQIFLQYMKNEINMHPELTIVSAGLFVLLIFGCVAPRLFYYVRSKSQKQMIKSHSSSKSHSKDNQFHIIEQNLNNDDDSDDNDKEGQSWASKQDYRITHRNTGSKKRSDSITSDEEKGHNKSTIEETTAVSSGSNFMSLTTLIRRKLLSSQSTTTSDYHIPIDTISFSADEPLQQPMSQKLSYSSHSATFATVASAEGSPNNSNHHVMLKSDDYTSNELICTQPTMTTTSSDISLKSSESMSDSCHKDESNHESDSFLDERVDFECDMTSEYEPAVTVVTE